MDNNIIVAIIAGTSSIVTATITALVTLKVADRKNANNTSFSKNNDFKRKQIDDFYIPFYKLYVQNVFPESSVVRMSLKTAAIFLELFEDNINLMGHESQELLKPLQITYHQWCENDCEYFKPYDFARAFLELTDQLFEEYNVLCLELGLPLPAKANYFYKERNNDR